ncbi:MAG: sulfatase, partial [Nannocystaceae bacterium]
MVLGSWGGMWVGGMEALVNLARPGATFEGGALDRWFTAAVGMTMLAAIFSPICIALFRPARAFVRAVTNFSRTVSWGAGWHLTALCTALIVLGVATGLADGLVYRNLYPTPHLLVGLTGAAAWYLLGVMIWEHRAPYWPPWIHRVLIGGALIWIILGSGAVVSLQHSQSLRATLVREGSWTARIATALPNLAIGETHGVLAGEGDARPRCRWPVAQSVQSPNHSTGYDVLLVTIDALRGDLGGDRLDSTLPQTMRRLRGATVFDRAYAPAPRTVYSSYAMLTGRYPIHLDFVAATTSVDDQIHVLTDDHPIMVDPAKWRLRHRYPVNDQHPTIAGILEEHGYTTAAVVPDVGLLPATGITREFSLVDQSPYLRNGRRDAVGITSGYSSDAAIKFFSTPTGRDSPSSPRFAWVHYLDPHHPYEANPPATPESAAPERYFSEIQRVDEELARVLDRLEAFGRRSNTLIIITGDHGEEFRDHGGLQHGTTLYDELMRVPLVFDVPDPAAQSRGRRHIATPVSLVDIVPTLLDLLGVSASATLDGRTLAPVLLNRAKTLTERPLLLYNTSYTES